MALKPGSVLSNNEKLRTNSPAPMTSITASAISVVTSTLRNRSRPTPPVDPLLASCSAAWISVRANRSTGASPKARPVTAVVPKVNSSTPPSRVTSSSRGRFTGPTATRRSMPSAARAMPTAAPAAASTMLSVNNCRPIRTLPAPKADRTAISRPRSAMRDSRRFTTLTHAMSSKRAVAPRRMRSAVRVSPTTDSCSGMSVVPYARFQFGYSASSLLAMTARSARAASMSTPVFTRPITSIHRA